VADGLPLPQFSHEDATALCHSRLPTAHIRPPSQVLGPGREPIEHGDEHAHARAAAAAGPGAAVCRSFAGQVGRLRDGCLRARRECDQLARSALAFCPALMTETLPSPLNVAASDMACDQPRCSPIEHRRRCRRSRPRIRQITDISCSIAWPECARLPTTRPPRAVSHGTDPEIRARGATDTVLRPWPVGRVGELKRPPRADPDDPRPSPSAGVVSCHHPVIAEAPLAARLAG
jgi:hypothetical protein